MKKEYQILTRAEHEAASVIKQFCQANGQILLPIVEMIESASQVVNSVVHEVGRSEGGGEAAAVTPQNRRRSEGAGL